MGRGRAKAKQTKVARALKYSTPQTDLERLQEELSAGESDVAREVEVDDDDDDPYAKYLADEDEASA